MRVLIAVDGTHECEVSVPIAAKLARALDADVYLLQVLGGFAATSGHVHHEPEWTGGIEPEVLGMMKKARTYLEDLALQHELPVERTRCLVGRSENPAEEIITVARNSGVDLIVMSSHCGGWLRQLTKGSVCSEVVHSKVCPVLCVPVHHETEESQHRAPMGARR
jgi:nucleotide-binding universal stress UspA family protein